MAAGMQFESKTSPFLVVFCPPPHPNPKQCPNSNEGGAALHRTLRELNPIATHINTQDPSGTFSVFAYV